MSRLAIAVWLRVPASSKSIPFHEYFLGQRLEALRRRKCRTWQTSSCLEIHRKLTSRVPRNGDDSAVICLSIVRRKTRTARSALLESLGIDVVLGQQLSHQFRWADKLNCISPSQAPITYLAALISPQSSYMRLFIVPLALTVLR